MLGINSTQISARNMNPGWINSMESNFNNKHCVLISLLHVFKISIIYSPLKVAKHWKSAPIKTRHISVMNLNFCLVFFTLLTFSCFTSAFIPSVPSTQRPSIIKCYKRNGEIVDCSGSCWKTPNNRFVIQFINGKV